MADRSFGVREINIVGSAGTPTISSPNNINLNGNKVAISTDLQVGRNATVAGIITANAFYGDGTNLTGVTGVGTQRADDVALNFGDSDDLQIYHNGVSNVITGISSRGTGKVDTFLTVHDLYVNVHSGQYASARFKAGSVGVELYSGTASNNVGYLRFAAAGIGCTVYGDLRVTAGTGGSGGAAFRRNVAIGTDVLEATDALLVKGDANITGVVTANQFIGDGSGLTNLPGGGGGSIAGISTTTTSFFNTLHATGTIDIGTSNAGVAVTHMTIDSADVSGTIRNRIQSGAGNTNAVLDIQTKEFLVTDPYAGKGALISADASGTKLYKDDSLKLQTIGTGVTVTGTMYATAFSGDGSQLTGVPISGTEGSFTRVDSQQLVVSGLSTFQGNVYLGDGDVLYIGDSNDLQLYHNNVNSVIRDAGTGSLFLQSNDIVLTSVANTNLARFTEGAEVDLYYNGSQKFNTTGAGVTVLGTLETQQIRTSGISTFFITFASSDYALFGDNDHSDTPYWTIEGTQLKNFYTQGVDFLARKEIKIAGPFNSARTATFDTDNQRLGINTTSFAGGYALEVNGQSYFREGLTVTGVSTCSGGVDVGGSGSNAVLKIESDGIDSFIKEVDPLGELTISSNQLKIESPSFETLARFNENADVKLYYNNLEKFATTNDGVSVSGILTVSNTTYLSTLDVSSSCSFGQGSFGRLNITNDDVNLYGNIGINTDANVTGILTAKSLHVNSTVGDGSDRGFTTKYYITSSGSSAYLFAGPGVLNSTTNPTLYFHRGFTYILENSTGSGHPFELRVSNGGAAYNPGGSFLTGSINGTQILTVPFNAPNSIVYQCTLHGGMVGTINFVT